MHDRNKILFIQVQIIMKKPMKNLNQFVKNNLKQDEKRTKMHEVCII